MAALLFRQLHGLNTLHTFLQCIRTIHFWVSWRCSWAWPESWGGGLTAAHPVLAQPVPSPIPTQETRELLSPPRLKQQSPNLPSFPPTPQR